MQGFYKETVRPRNMFYLNKMDTTKIIVYTAQMDKLQPPL